MPRKRRQSRIPTPAWERPHGAIGSRILGLQDGVKMFDGPTAALDRRKLDEIYAMEVL